MADAAIASPFLSEPVSGAEAPAEESRHALVLDAYEAGLARSLNERNAFEAAVHLYRCQRPGLQEDEVRRAVANIICRKS